MLKELVSGTQCRSFFFFSTSGHEAFGREWKLIIQKDRNDSGSQWQILSNCPTVRVIRQIAELCSEVRWLIAFNGLAFEFDKLTLHDEPVTHIREMRPFIPRLIPRPTHPTQDEYQQ